MANETTPTPQKPGSAPPGWYPDPYHSGDLSTEWYWNGTSWEGNPRRTPPSRNVVKLTQAAFVLVIVAWVALISFGVGARDWDPCTSDPPMFWLWVVSAIAGSVALVLSFVLAVRRSHTRLADRTMAMALVGASLGFVVVGAGTGC
jgi:hypothetical protein